MSLTPMFAPLWPVLIIGFMIISSGVDGQSQKELNNRPIFGVLLQETPDKSEQYLAASYVKYLESAGARVAPVFINQPLDYYQRLVSHLNGILLPGGGSDLTGSSYALAADALLNAAIEANNNGTYFPVWGTCLGFEMLILKFARTQDWISTCYVENVALSLNIESDMPMISRLFNSTKPNPIIDILSNSPVTVNYHKRCLNTSEFDMNKNINEQFILVSRSTYGSEEFVSLVEHQHYPFYGSAWHPEKNQFEFVVNANRGNFSHDWNSIQVGQYFANFLVNEARNNSNHFRNKLEESQHLIYNYNAYRHYTGKEVNATFEEVYRFPPNFSGNSGTRSHQVYMLSLFSSLLSIYLFSQFSQL